VQVETAKVQPLQDALSEEQWRQYNADLASEAEARKQAEEAAEQGRQLAEAQAAEQRAAEEAEAERQSKLTKVCATSTPCTHTCTCTCILCYHDQGDGNLFDTDCTQSLCMHDRCSPQS